MKGTDSRASSATTTMSQCSSRVRPIPTARPRTAATAGLSRSAKALRKSNTGICAGCCPCDPRAMKSAMSLPAEKLSPWPLKTSTRTASSVRARTVASASTAYMAWVMAFFFSGRASVTVRTPPASSV